MIENRNYLLNFITITAFILYAIGIYLETAILNKRWGNSAVDLSIQMFGPFIGVIFVVIVGGLILFLAYLISFSKYFSLALNCFLCWFWIFSLYQCAINTFLSFYGLPNEPINLFFKTIAPTFWYPLKELVFTIISLLLTYIWMNKVNKEKIKYLDWIIIGIIIIILISSIIYSQLHLINANSNIYS
ncbi:MAG: hypothetical protein ACTSVV_07870 [Promethearchaeota archaeon]